MNYTKFKEIVNKMGLNPKIMKYDKKIFKCSKMNFYIYKNKLVLGG